MDLLIEQLARRVAELGEWREVDHSPPAEVRVLRGDHVDARLPGFDDSGAPVLPPGGDWREPTGATVWLPEPVAVTVPTRPFPPSVPLVSVVPPVYVLFELRMRVPIEILFRPPVPKITESTVSEAPPAI